MFFVSELWASGSGIFCWLSQGLYRGLGGFCSRTFSWVLGCIVEGSLGLSSWGFGVFGFRGLEFQRGFVGKGSAVLVTDTCGTLI